MNAPEQAAAQPSGREYYVTMAKALCFEQALREILLVGAAGLAEAHAIARRTLHAWNAAHPTGRRR